MIQLAMIHQIADTLFLRALDSLTVGLPIASFAALLVRFSPRQSSAARFAVWFSVLIAIALLPGIDGALWSTLHAHEVSNAKTAAFTVPGSWAIYFFCGWGMIALIGLARVAAGLIHLSRLRSTFLEVDLSRLDAATQAIFQRYQSRRRIVLCTSAQVSVPTAVGLVSPTVVIPAWLMDGLSPAELNQILLHELAHLSRWDDWTNLAQKIVKAIFFFHPAVWWLERKISLEREMACDDEVLAENNNPRAYAECLLHLAEKSVIRRGMALAQAAVGRIRQTTLRVAQILDLNRPVGSGGWKPAVSLVAGFAFLSVIGISRAPQLVTFQELQPQVTVASSTHALNPERREASEELSAGTKSFSHAAKVVPAKYVTPPAQKIDRATSNQRTALGPSLAQHEAVVSNRQSQAAAPDIAQILHLTDLRVDRAASAPVFFVVEQAVYQTDGQSLYRVSVWRIVVLHPAVPSDSRTPRKET